MRGSLPPLWFCPRHWLQTTPKTTATWATSNSFPLPPKPTAFGGSSRRARTSVLCSRTAFSDNTVHFKRWRGLSSLLSRDSSRLFFSLPAVRHRDPQDLRLREVHRRVLPLGRRSRRQVRWLARAKETERKRPAPRL